MAPWPLPDLAKKDTVRVQSIWQAISPSAGKIWNETAGDKSQAIPSAAWEFVSSNISFTSVIINIINIDIKDKKF